MPSGEASAATGSRTRSARFCSAVSQASLRFCGTCVSVSARQLSRPCDPSSSPASGTRRDESACCHPLVGFARLYEKTRDPHGRVEGIHLVRRMIATALVVSAIVLGGGAAPALAGHHVGSCPNESSGWTLVHGAGSSPHDVNGDGHICVKEVKGNGNHGGGVNHKDNNSPL